jgi:hypothetical protein
MLMASKQNKILFYFQLSLTQGPNFLLLIFNSNVCVYYNQESITGQQI